MKDSETNWNTVTGNMSALAPLQNLTLLNVSRNVLGVTKFPEVVQTLPNMRSLTIDNSLIPGPFPVGLSNLKKIEYLYLGNNSFSGPIPGELGLMTTLKELTIWGSNFSSKLPPDIGNLVNLTYLNCNRCFLWGGLPPEYGKLKNLKKLHFYKNALTGPIPEEYRNLTNLVELRIESNQLFGSLEPWIIGLPNIELVNVNFNQLYKSLPPVIDRTTTNLTQMYVKCNYFTGKFPLIDSSFTTEFDANCYDNPGTNGTLDAICSRELSCIPFQNYLVSNGGCPPCPNGQHMANKTLCICSSGDEITTSKKSKYSTWLIMGGAVGGALLAIVALLLTCFWICRRRKFEPDHAFIHTEAHDGEKAEPWDAPKGVQRYTLDDLARATNNFSKEHEIGAGGFGKVFYGNFPGNKTLAIKRVSTSTSANDQTQFRNEVLLLSRLHHKNLVRLEGFCDENNLQILVYEHMRNGNLHNYLFRKSAGKYLDWYKRLEIAVHIAQGLEYLHSSADPPVIHRDVKPTNILLDENLVAKLADFGVSKEPLELHPHVSASSVGYFDPDYFMTQKLTTASDVYGFGVVLLELVTGQKVFDHVSRGDECNLIKWVERRVGEGGVDRIVDMKLEGNYPRRIFMKMTRLALHCSASEKKERPTMKAVVTALEPLLREAQRPNEAVWKELPDTADNESTFTGSSSRSFSHHRALTQTKAMVDPR